MFARNMCYWFIKSVIQDYFKIHLDACTSIDSKKNRDCCIHRLKCNNVARFYKFMRLKNKVCIKATVCAAWTQNCSLRVIRFWSDNAECSAQCDRSDNQEGRLIEVLLYLEKSSLL